MQKRKIRFLRYINRPKLFFIIEYDDLGVLSTILIGGMLAGAASNIAGLYSFIMSFALAAFFTKLYRVFKNERNRGYIHHFFYVYDLPNPFGISAKTYFEEAKHFKNKRNIPYGFEMEFRE